MLRRRGIIRWAVALTLAVALAQPAAAAGSPGFAAGEDLDWFWAGVRSWITSAWPWALADATSDRGPYIDPDGATSGPDRGGIIDPNG